ncbi:type III-A CRISPR-associated RAMP protein Csm5 [Mangrovibacterium sp.]|uniref:type III-A CRISPR-associated RAMP protein Csm5 n=1 Tax=Mangrovibacterium sp. TaxID=1961364 RepID=UPI0035650FCD
MSIFEVQTIGPVHVGSGRFLQNKLEYVFGGQRIGIIDDKKAFDLIGSDRIGAWVSSIDRGESLVSFLKNYGIKPKLGQLCSRQIKIQCDIDKAKSMQNLKELIHNGQGLPYIPGSTIKGAIRSAVLNHVVREKNRLFDQVITGGGRPSAKLLEKELFGSDPNTDLFRFLRIGDAYFEQGSETAAIFTSLNQKGNPERPKVAIDQTKNQLVETIGAGHNTKFKLWFDMVGMQKNIHHRKINVLQEFWGNPLALVKLLNQNTTLILNEEINSWSEFDSDDAMVYKQNIKNLQEELQQCLPNECIIRLAHGAGWTFINGNWIKQEKLVGDEVYEQVLNAARPQNEARYSEYSFPKSRRVSNNGALPGFVRLRLIAD